MMRHTCEIRTGTYACWQAYLFVCQTLGFVILGEEPGRAMLVYTTNTQVRKRGGGAML